MNTSTTQGQRLAVEAAEAAEVRDARTHPDVVALRVDRVRLLADRFIWAGIITGLLFTMINVQVFAAQKASTFSLAWWGAWFLDPAVTVILLGVLIAEGVTARWQIQMGPWARAAKWSLLSATYVMNTWEAWAAHWWAGVVLHSVPPLAVFMGAECRTDISDKLTECVGAAHEHAIQRAQQRETAEREKTAAEAAAVGQERPMPVGAGASEPPAVEPRPVARPSVPSQSRPARPTATVPPVPPARTAVVPVDDQLLSRARAVRNRQLSQGKTAGHRVLARELGVPERVARELVRRLDEPPLHVVAGGR